MRRRALAALGAGAVGAILVGCTLVIGGTEGYSTEPPSSTDAGPASCAEGGCITLSCASAFDCDAGESCCLSLAGSSIAASCNAGPCTGPVPIQLCKSTDECRGPACVEQQCDRFGISACGNVPACTPR